MATRPLDDETAVAVLEFYDTSSLQIALVVMHFYSAGLGVAALGLSDLNTNLTRWWQASSVYGANMLKNSVHSGWRFRRVRSRIVTGGAEVVRTEDNTSGAITGNELPLGIAGLIRWQASGTGPSVRGRSFMPPPSVSQTASGVPTSTYRSTLAASATALLSILPAASIYGWTPAVYSRKLGQVADIVSAEVPGYWSWQPRRRWAPAP